jgi:hypothetical protein
MGSVVAACCAFLGKLLADEFKAWFPWIAERILQCAVRGLPENQRVRYSEEWRSHLNETPGEIGKSVCALGFLRAGWKMSRILSEEASQFPEEPESAKPGRLQSLHIVFGTPVPKNDVQNKEIASMAIEATNSIRAYGKGVEGSLDVFWENNLEPTAPPLVRIHFLRYTNFRSGAQQANRILGFSNLELYLTEIGLTSEDAKHWVKRLVENRSVSIPNVMLPEPHVAAYEPHP